MMPKPEIALKDIIIYSNNRVDTKRTIRNIIDTKENKILKIIIYIN